jgi:membrane-associated phospholipid phosphatase
MQLNYHLFKNGAIITTVTGIALLLLSVCLGKNECFLLLNTDLGTTVDQFFRYWTNLGDGAVWIIVGLLFVIYRRKLLPLCFSAIIISTLIVQVTKNLIFPSIPRPTKAINELALIHTVPGVELHTMNSFPSGHTTTAFTVFLLACLVIPKKWVIPAGFMYALLVGYSRVYLAQHFPLDVGAGMLAAVISMLLSITIQKRFPALPPRRSASV